MGRRGRVLAALALLASVVAAAPGSEDLAAARSSADPLQALLDQRARAILEGDSEGFARTLDSASTGFVQDQLRRFENLGGVPFRSYRLELDRDALGDLARPSDRRRYPGAEDVQTWLVRERYRLRGFDRKDVYHDHYLTFVKRSEGWGVGSDEDLDDVGLLSQRSLWDAGPVAARKQGRFLALSQDCSPEPSCHASVDSTVAAATAALPAVERMWTRDWSGRVPIILPRSSEELGDIIQATFPLESFIAFAFWTGGADGEPGVRIIVNPDRAATLAARGLDVLTHELAHVAMLPSSGPYVPRFMEEGAAEYIRHGASPSAISAAHAAARAAAGLPQDWRFFVGTSSELYRIYQRSLSAVAFIAERWGWETFQDLYVELGSRGGGAGTARFHFDRALREVLDLGVESFEREWASSIGS